MRKITWQVMLIMLSLFALAACGTQRSASLSPTIPTSSTPTATPSSSVLAQQLLFAALSNNTLVALDTTKGSVQWRYQAGGQILFAPLLDGSTLYVTAGQTLVALKAADGTVLWHYDAGEQISGPAVTSGTVVILSTSGRLLAFNTADGTARWNHQFQAGSYFTPAAADGVFYVSTQSGLYALNASDGTQRWQYPLHQGSYTSPNLNNGVVYIIGFDSNLYALTASDGSMRWKQQVPTSPSTGALPLTLNGGMIYGGAIFGASSSGPSGWAFTLDAQTGSMRWKKWIQGGPQGITGDTNVMYLGVGTQLLALNGSDGTQRWQSSVVDNAPLLKNGLLYAGANDGAVYSLDPGTGATRWHTAPLGATVLSLA